MDVLAIVLLLIVIILIVNNKANINQKLNALEFQIMELRNLLKQSEKESKAPETQWKTFSESTPVQPPSPEIIKSQQQPIPAEVPKPDTESTPEPVIEREKEVFTDAFAGIKKTIKTAESIRQAPKEPELSFFERYPDLERFIGENLVNKIGIAILVLAIGFFVKYAIDNNWIGPVGRVGIGIICGGILVAFAHRMRNNYKAFSSVLVGGGLAIFYFTITLAFQQFHLFSQIAALIILVGITVFAVTLSLLYDKQELAVIALIGGFASPFMVSNGSANYNGLFLYLLILNAGLLIIAYYKSWRILNISSFLLSVIVFGSMIYIMPPGAYAVGFWYATIFYLLFFAINIVNNVRENKKFIAVDFSILLINTALYFSAGLYLLTVMHQGQFRGLFSAGLGALNLVLSFILFRNKKVDTNVLYLLIGITLTFISLTAPIQLHGNNITLFWASEAVLMYWLYQKSSIKLMKLTSLVVWLAMMISLLMDLTSIYGNANLHLIVIANKGLITTLFAAVSSYLLYLLIKNDSPNQIYGITINKNLFRIIGVVLLFVGGLLEVNHQFEFYYPDSGVNTLYVMLYVPAFVFVFNFVSQKIKGDKINWKVSTAIIACAIGIYLTLSEQYFELLATMLESKKINTGLFSGHWISDIFIGVLFYILISLCRNNLKEDQQKGSAWLISGAIVVFLSLEICLLSNLIFYSGTTPIDDMETVYIKTGLPVLWGISSFILMWIGMRNKQRVLRIISLTLFLLTLIKLFLFDINNIPVAGKIAAFFCLGILLLIISFMYQKVKKIIIDDETKTDE